MKNNTITPTKSLLVPVLAAMVLSLAGLTLWVAKR